jgi:hypothetical protein
MMAEWPLTTPFFLKRFGHPILFGGDSAATKNQILKEKLESLTLKNGSAALLTNGMARLSPYSRSVGPTGLDVNSLKVFVLKGRLYLSLSICLVRLLC